MSIIDPNLVAFGIEGVSKLTDEQVDKLYDILMDGFDPGLTDQASREIYLDLSRRDRLIFLLTFSAAISVAQFTLKHGPLGIQAHNKAVAETEGPKGECHPTQHNGVCPNCPARHICWPDTWDEPVTSHIIREMINGR